MTAPIRVVLVGFGKIARDQHVPAIAADARFALAGVVDPAAVSETLPHTADLKEFLADGPPVDAVAICTPPTLRSALARQAIAAGKHVLLEKPPGVTSAEVEALIPLAKAAGVSLMTAWHSRYAAAVAPAREWLAARRVTGGRIVWREDYRVWHPGQDWIWTHAGMGVFDPGINALSILTHLLPGPWTVQAATLETPSDAESPVRVDLDLRDGDGLQVQAAFDFLHPGPPHWDLSLQTDAGELTLSRGGADLLLPGAPAREGTDREYPNLYSEFADLIRAGGSAVDVTPLEIVEQAVRRGRRVTAPPLPG
jgi:D-galactose 1-dehydrogenase